MDTLQDSYQNPSSFSASSIISSSEDKDTHEILHNYTYSKQSNYNNNHNNNQYFNNSNQYYNNDSNTYVQNNNHGDNGYVDLNNNNGYVENYNNNIVNQNNIGYYNNNNNNQNNNLIGSGNAIINNNQSMECEKENNNIINKNGGQSNNKKKNKKSKRVRVLSIDDQYDIRQNNNLCNISNTNNNNNNNNTLNNIISNNASNNANNNNSSANNNNNNNNNNALQLQQQNKRQLQFVQYPLENYKYFLCSGDMMIEFYNDNDSEYCQQRRMTNFRNFKSIKQSEKIGDNLRLILKSKQNVVNDFSYVINLLESKQDQYFFQFAQLLRRYNEFQKIARNYIQSVIDAYSPDALNELQIIQELRQAYHTDFMDNYLAKNTTDEFYCLVQVGPNFHTKALGYNMLQFSKAMIALLGVDEDQMIAINMRNGFRDFIYSDNKNDMYIKYLEGILNGALNCQETDKFSFDTKLFTYDRIIIPCKCSIKRYVVPLPSQLEYKSTQNQSSYFNLDMINYMKFQVDFNQIKYVLQQRQSINSQEIIQEQLDSMEYSVQSQIFIEKYYPQNINNNSNIINEKQSQ